MTGAVVAASGGLFPFLLDNFETNDFATKWSGSTAGHTRDTVAPISGAASYRITAADLANPTTARWLTSPPNGMQVLRGDVLSARIRGTLASGSVGSNPLYLYHTIMGYAATVSGQPNDAVMGSLYVHFNITNLSLIYQDTAGGVNTITNNSITIDSTRTDLELRSWFNSPNHPTAPRACGAQVIDIDDGSVLASATGLVPSVTDTWNSGVIGIGSNFPTKVDPCSYWIDDIRILSRAAA